jgi:glycogen debranching enzyme
MINPKNVEKHAREAKERDVNLNEAWEDVDYVDLEVDDDFIQKCLAIRAGEPYDTRVQIEVNFSDDEMARYMKLAHEQDITFNQLVENALQQAIESYKQVELNGPLDK